MAYGTTLNAEIAARVRTVLAEKHQSITDLAASTGLADRTLRRRLQGTSAWTTDELNLIAHALSTPIPHFLPEVA